MAKDGPTVPLRDHIEALSLAHDRLDQERDRRYAEVNTEREKALKIKETADLAALQLAREIQTYKDEKANELREQISSERGLYVTRAELKPIAEYVANQQGRSQGISTTTATLVVVLTLLFSAAGLVLFIANH